MNIESHEAGCRNGQNPEGHWRPESCSAFTSESLHTMLILVTLKWVLGSMVGKLSSLKSQIEKRYLSESAKQFAFINWAEIKASETKMKN